MVDRPTLRATLAGAALVVALAASARAADPFVPPTGVTKSPDVNPARAKKPTDRYNGAPRCAIDDCNFGSWAVDGESGTMFPVPSARPVQSAEVTLEDGKKAIVQGDLEVSLRNGKFVVEFWLNEDQHKFSRYPIRILSGPGELLRSGPNQSYPWDISAAFGPDLEGLQYVPEIKSAITIGKTETVFWSAKLDRTGAAMIELRHRTFLKSSTGKAYEGP